MSRTDVGQQQDQAVLPSPPFWMRHRHLPAVLATGLTLLAFAIEAVRLTLAVGPVALTSVGVAITAIGLASTRVNAWAGLAVGWIGVVVVAGSGWDPIVEYSAIAFTLFALISRGALRPLAAGISTAAVVIAAFVLLAVTTSTALLSTDVLAGVASTATGAALGSVLLVQDRYWASLEQHATDILASREHLAQRRVIEERVRVARDLHDIIGHQVAVVSVHLGALEVTAGRDAAATDQSLTAARTAVQAILADTQRTVAVLREGAGPGGGAGPAPDLTGVPELIDSFTAIGLLVEAALPERLDGIDPTESLTAFRVVQEALTNASRHGPGTAAVTIQRQDGELRIEVENPVSTATQERSGGGFGLVGMRERVAAAGGVLEVGLAGSTFRVVARLDVDGGRVS